MGKRGRKPIQIDWNIVDSMAEIAGTAFEIACHFGVEIGHLETICKREKKIKLSDYLKQKRGKGNLSLRRSKRLACIVDRNPTMLIWESKQRLNERDPDNDIPPTSDGKVLLFKLFHRNENKDGDGNDSGE